MPLRDKKQIRDLFNAHRESFQLWGDQTGLNGAIETFSQMIGNIRDAGLDVSLDMTGFTGEQGFSLFADAVKIVPLTGCLHIGSTRLLAAFCVKLDEKECLLLGLSSFDMQQQGGKEKVRSKVYDLTKESAWQEIESELVRICARNSVVADHDPAGVFGTALKNAPVRLAKKGGNFPAGGK